MFVKEMVVIQQRNALMLLDPAGANAQAGGRPPQSQWREEADGAESAHAALLRVLQATRGGGEQLEVRHCIYIAIAYI